MSAGTFGRFGLIAFFFLLASSFVASGGVCAEVPEGYVQEMKYPDFDLFEKKSVGDADLVAFRGIGILAATPLEVATVILDRDHRLEWMRDTRDLKLLRVYAPGNFSEYALIQTPFIIKNRDFVVRTNVEFDAAKNRVIIVSRSVVEESAPETGAIRGHMNEGRFVLEPGPAPGTTRITADMDVDPKGTVPLWIVNKFQKNWPYGMFSAMKGFLRRGVATLPDDLKPVFARPVTPGPASP